MAAPPLSPIKEGAIYTNTGSVDNIFQKQPQRDTTTISTDDSSSSTRPIRQAMDQDPNSPSSPTILDTTLQKEPMVENCTLCVDGSAPLDPSATFVAGDFSLTCQLAYEKGPLTLPQSNCTFWQQQAGSNICRCLRPFAKTAPNCTLCQQPSTFFQSSPSIQEIQNNETTRIPLPRPFLEGPTDPTRTCASLAVDARRDVPENCIFHQGVVGTYCGCNNPRADAATCRICGPSFPLPNPSKYTSPALLTALQQSLALTTRSSPQNNLSSPMTCAQWEFQANLDGSRCRAYREATPLLFQECCTETLAPTMTPNNNGIGTGIPSLSATTTTLILETAIAMIMTVVLLFH